MCDESYGVSPATVLAQADIKGTGTLTGHELSGAMHDVIGVNPTRSETEAVLRLHGECADRGESAEAPVAGREQGSR